ncbi:LRR receptor-like serine threonine-protein kinase [Seminavis robusta]|uniref:LRR receptor-like serine threonine-protein kinase n=1 Tax=Seminavis robusta TaxID=568900 RepID=A0A9N8H5D3_9STRA|nr:LRR receptor-like serine threonine-protein kinase [Seminavis robusta]|eukprot:Sro111_g055190.1 LRR receptor-like serine threonine-protein kinase (802) ;mRNA; f:31483-33888
MSSSNNHANDEEAPDQPELAPSETVAIDVLTKRRELEAAQYKTDSARHMVPVSNHTADDNVMIPREEEEQSDQNSHSSFNMLEMVEERVSMAAKDDDEIENEDLKKGIDKGTSDDLTKKKKRDPTMDTTTTNKLATDAQVNAKLGSLGAIAASSAGAITDAQVNAKLAANSSTNPTVRQMQRPGAYMGAPGVELQRTSTVSYQNFGSASDAELKSSEFTTSMEFRSSLVVNNNHRAATTLPELDDDEDDDEPQAFASGNSAALQEDSGGLVQANPVRDEFRNSNLQSAAPVLEQNKNQPREQQTNTIYMAGAAFLLLLVVIVVVAVVVTKSKEDTIVIVEATQSPTSNPTFAPTTWTVQDYVLNLLPEATVNSVLQDVLSAQAQAFDWIMEDLMQNADQDFTEDRIVQRFVLATFFFATGGIESWSQNDNWLNHTVHECDWFAKDGSKLYWPPNDDPDFPCFRHTATYKQLWLYANNLEGTLPMNELSLLTKLTSVSLNANPGLQGTLSALWGKLTDLEQLDMGRLEGPSKSKIPSEFGLLTAMTSLNLLNNFLTGTIPTELFLLSKLHHWFLDNNELTGTISTLIGNMNALHNPYFHSNLLSGPLPSEIGRIPGNHLSLDQNLLTGTLPTELGQVSTVEHMVVMKNALTGPLPSELGLLHRPKDETKGWGFGAGPWWYLNAGYNQLSGEIPSEFGTMFYMKHIWLNDNKFSGTLPQELAILAAENSNDTSLLLSLNILNNPFLSGVIPESLCSIGPDANVSCPIGGTWYKDCGLSFDCLANNNVSTTGDHYLCGCGCDCE